MGNTLLTPQIIAKEAIMTLQNQMVFAGLVHRDFSNEFVKVGDTITVRKPATFVSKEFNGTIEVQDATESGVPVKMDKHLDISFSVDSKDLTLNIVDFSEQFIKPVMEAHAQALDAMLAKQVLDIPYVVDVSDTASMADFANVGKVMNLNKVPMSGRNLVLGPNDHSKYVVLPQIMNAEKSGSTQALRDANMGRILGLDTYMDQNVVTTAKGTLAASNGTLSATGDKDATQVVISATAASGTLVKGDILSFADVPGTYVVTEGATAAANAITAKIYPALPVAVAGKAVTVKAAHTANVAFHKNAFALVTRPLAAPMGANKAETLSFNGISCRVVYFYDNNAKKDIISVDFLCGVKTLTPELAVRLAGK